MKKSIFAVLLVTVLLAMTFAGCQTAGDEDAIRFGGLAPLTGKLSEYGIATNNGIKMAIDEINAAGGILGKKITYKVYDEKGDVSEAVTNFDRLVNDDKIQFFIGDVTSTPTLAVAERAAQVGIPMITATGTNADITKAGSNVFRTCFTDPYQGELMANYAAKKLGAKTAAVLYDATDDYSKGCRDSFKAAAEKLGMTVVADEAYNAGAVDFSAQLTKIAGQNPDVFFIPVYYEDVAKIAVQAKDKNITAKMLGADGWDGVLSKLTDATYNAVEGIYFCGHYSAESQDEKVVNFIKKYTETYGSAPNMFAALGYDAAYMMADAVKNAGSVDYTAVCNAMKELKFDGVTGHIVFDENRNPIKPGAITTIQLGQDEDGKTTANYKFVESFSVE